MDKYNDCYIRTQLVVVVASHASCFVSYLQKYRDIDLALGLYILSIYLFTNTILLIILL